jgi:hypothetical protein
MMIIQQRVNVNVTAQEELYKMANWLIDTGNTKRGFYFSRIQDIFKNANIQQVDGELVTSFADGDSFMGYHSSIDPRNLVIFDDINPVTNESTTSIGLKRVDAVVSIPLKLDTVKAFLDSDQGSISPIVALQYQFESPDAAVTTREAIEAAKYVTKVTTAEGVMQAVDIETGETIWQSPDKTHVVNYVFFGKVDGVPDTYYMLLNSFRTELYNELRESNGHKFFFLDQSTGGMKEFLLRPEFSGAKLLDNDVVVAAGNVFSMNLFDENSAIIANTSVTPASIEYSVESNALVADNGAGGLTVDMTGREFAYISVKIADGIVLVNEPKISVSRTFTIHK